MREIGSIAQEKDAQALADYLLTLDITTKLVTRADGSCAVWVHREDRVPQAREVLAEFVRDPSDDRYRSAAQEAKTLRKQAEQVEAEYRKNVRDIRERWARPLYQRAPLTVTLMVASIVAALYTDMGEKLSTVQHLTFSVWEYDREGVLVDHGFANILAGGFYRLITPIFLHFGLPHLFFNMIALLSFGDQIETAKGTWRLAWIVILAAVLGNIGEFFSSGGGFGGMSGVDFALAGYLWVKGNIQPEEGLMLSPRNALFMIAWFLLGILWKDAPQNGVESTFSHMANVAHGVGLAVGMLFGLMRY